MGDVSNGPRAGRGRSAQSLGVRAERRAAACLEAEGWTILGVRLRTAAGEIDLAASRDGLLALIEVKSRPSLAEAAAAIGARQRIRLLNAAALLVADHPDWGPAGIRFDVMLVDAAGQVRRVVDAFREE